MATYLLAAFKHREELLTKRLDVEDSPVQVTQTKSKKSKSISKSKETKSKKDKTKSTKARKVKINPKNVGNAPLTKHYTVTSVSQCGMRMTLKIKNRK